MLMMRLQRVGRKNDPSYRIVVTDKRTGVKSDKHVDRIGSYNPKTKQFQIDADKAKDWLSKGVQPSGTMHNLLISKKVIEGKKINVLPKKSPIIDEEAIKKAEEEAAAKVEAEAKAKEEAEAKAKEEAVEEAATEAPAEETAEPKIEVEVAADAETPAETPEEEAKEEEEAAKEESEKAQAKGDSQGD